MRPRSKILLINPNWTGITRQHQFQFKRIWPPLDLAVAAAMLEREKHFVRILDNNTARLRADQIGRLANCFDKIFVTSSPYDRWQCPSLDIRYFLDTVDHIAPEKLYLMGAHVTERPKALLTHTQARAAILGEPEQTILDIAQTDPGIGELPRIPQTAWLRGDQLVNPPPRKALLDLNQTPMPAFHRLPMDRYHYEFMGPHFTILEGSRGCPFKCNFCYQGMYGSALRRKTIERLITEIKTVIGRFGVQNIYFMDLEFGLNPKRLRAFCRSVLENRLRFKWCCQIRANDVDEDMLYWMKKAGCNLIHLGIESGSRRILEQSRKRIQLEDCRRTVWLARKHGIRTAIFMNFGFPGETPAEMNASIEFAIRLRPTYAAFHLLVPFPGTELARSIRLDPDDLPVQAYPQYNFKDHELKALKSVLRKAYLKFYLRPAYWRDLIRQTEGLSVKQVRLFARLVLG